LADDEGCQRRPAQGQPAADDALDRWSRRLALGRQALIVLLLLVLVIAAVALLIAGDFRSLVEHGVLDIN
jgi:hypothetical protein